MCSIDDFFQFSVKKAWSQKWRNKDSDQFFLFSDFACREFTHPNLLETQVKIVLDFVFYPTASSCENTGKNNFLSLTPHFLLFLQVSTITLQDSKVFMEAIFFFPSDFTIFTILYSNSSFYFRYSLTFLSIFVPQNSFQ